MLTGKELKIKRIMADIKANEVADYLQIHKSYVCKMEKEVQNIPIKLYEKWIDFLKI